MIVIERWYRKQSTIGILTVGKFRCFTLELPDLKNEQNISCIPKGAYDYFSKISASNGNVLELKNVPDRTYIQLHSGNFQRQTLGCILVGDSIKYLDGDSIPDVTNSKATLKKILKLAGNHGCISII